MTGITLSRRNFLRAGACALAGGTGLLSAGTAIAGERPALPAEKGPEATNEEILRSYYSAWEKRDWSPINDLLADDFTFTSPNDDDHISKSSFKTRCWQTQVDFIQRFELESVMGKDNQAFVKYLCRTKNGKAFRDVEYLRFRDGKIESIEAYFGGDLGFPSAASTGQR